MDKGAQVLPVLDGRSVMEKMCIVKWRKKDPQTVQEADPAVKTSSDQDEPWEEIISHTEKALLSDDPPVPVQKESAIDLKKAMSVIITPRKSLFVQLHKSIKNLLGGMTCGVTMDTPKQEDDKIIFNFHVKQVSTLRMLTAGDVCRMLHVSRSFLARLVTEGRIKSYKFGRLRRFLLQDLLDYLSRSETLCDTGTSPGYAEQESGCMSKQGT